MNKRLILATSLLVALLAAGFSLLTAAYGVPVAALVFASLLLTPLGLRADLHKLGPTLTTSQVLLDVLKSFRKWFPGLGLIGTEFRGTPLKLNQKYIAHIAGLPVASTFDRAQGGYKNGANSARGLLQDVPVTVDGQPTAPLLWQHLDQLKDSKNEYGEVIGNAGYVIAKAAADQGVFAKLTHRFFTREKLFAVADCDYDMLQAVTGQANQQGMLPTGRILFVNTDVANILAVDPRMISKDYAGQLLDGNGYRQWRNVGGYALIQEYPDLALNNGAALAGVTATAATDVLAKNDHGLETGDPVVISVIAGGAAGLAINTRYFVIKTSANAFKLAATYANAVAAVPVPIDITSDSEAGHLTLALTENVIAFACDKRAIGFLAGIPEGMQSDICESLGIPRTMVFETLKDPDGSMTMAAAKWQEGGTGDAYFVPTFVFGTHAGKQGDTTTSAAAAANAAGSGCDYAGIRIVKPAA